MILAAGESSDALLQVIQVFGSLFILADFALQQAGRLKADTVVYLAANLVGSALLAVLAAIAVQWGFLNISRESAHVCATDSPVVTPSAPKETA